MSLHITMMSNGSLEHFKDNSLTKFTNVLPPNLPLRGGKTYVRLRRIMISYKLDSSESLISDYVTVHLSELEPRTVNSTLSRRLGAFRFPPVHHITEEYAIHDFEHSAFFELQGDSLKQLSLFIAHTNNKQLKLARGPPTIAILEVTEMDRSSQFTVTCQSHNREENQVFPNNSMSRFRVKLPQEFKLSNWEVAMSNMAYPPDIKHTESKETASLLFSVRDSEFNGSLALQFRFKENSFEDENDPKDFASATTKCFAFVKRSLDRHHFWNKVLQFEEGLIDPDDEESGLAYQFKNISTRRQYRNTFKDHKTVRIKDLSDLTLDIFLDRKFLKIFGLHNENSADIALKVGERYVFKGNPDIRRIQTIPSTIGLVYCDIVEPCPVGNVMAPLLQIVPINIKSDDDEDGGLLNREVTIYEPQHLVFHPVICREFRDIQFEILQPDGRPHTFDDYPLTEINGGMTFTLMFRRQKMK